MGKDGGVLWADVILEPWPNGEEYEASCTRGCHDGPGEDCACGIHAWFDYPTMVSKWYPHNDRWRHASGVVSARGVVWLHEHGWRAQYVTVEAILDDVSDDDLPIPKGEIAEAYGIPIVKPEDYADFCQEQSLVLLRSE